jgi:hypothetical protein
VALVAIADYTSRRHLVVAGEGPIGSVAPGGGGEGRCGGVAVRTACSSKRRTCGGMYGVVGIGPVRLVATSVAAVAIRDARQIIVAIDVTGRAGRAGMEAIENETSSAVIESRARPARSVMARTALCDGKTLCIVDRVIRLLIRG